MLLTAFGGRAPAPASLHVYEAQATAHLPAADREDVSAWALPRVPDIEPYPGTTGLSASRCADCHAEIAAEWAASTHAHAWVDPQFQAELHKDPEIGWICLNCHTPLQAQLPERVTLFRGNLVLPSGDPADLAHRIHAALVHEAHDWRGLVPSGDESE